MLGHYGWIMTFDDIDHTNVAMTAGRVYVHRRDVEHGVSLERGDIVSFYLYADDQGLGAEGCQLEESASPTMCADADEFVPSFAAPLASWNVCASEFVPTSTIPSSLSIEAAEFVPTSFDIPSGFSMEAAEFVPSKFNSDVPAFIPAATCSNMVLPSSNFTAINLAFFSDDESDDESSIGGDISGNDGDKESVGGDEESNAGDKGCDECLESFQQDMEFESSSDLDVVVKSRPWRKAAAVLSADDSTRVVKRAPWREAAAVSSADDSTSAGTCSDSEDETLVHCVVRAPPGLSMPAGWRAPPGLSLPALVV